MDPLALTTTIVSMVLSYISAFLFSFGIADSWLVAVCGLCYLGCFASCILTNHNKELSRVAQEDIKRYSQYCG